MRRFFRTTVFMLAAATLATSCEPAFLDEKVHSFMTMENFYQTDEDFTTGLIGVYDMLGSTTMLSAESGLINYMGTYSFGHMLIGDCGTDLFRLTVANQTNITPMETYNIDAGATVPLMYWIAQYMSVSRANALISHVPDNEQSAHRRQCKAEATFLRSLAYFNLVRAFGGVPLSMEQLPSGTYVDPTRVPAPDVLAANISALDAVTEYLPATSASYGRVTKKTAYGLLAKMNLYMASMKRLSGFTDDIKLGGINSFDAVDAKVAYEKARDYSLQAITAVAASGNPLFSGSTALAYTDNFYPVESSPDLLLDVQFSSDYTIEGCFIFRAFGPQGTVAVGGGGNWLRPLWVNHYSTYDQLDDRYLFNITKYQITQNNTTKAIIITQPATDANEKSWMAFAKFRQNGVPTWAINNGPMNVPVLRVAEMCLIHAEALAELADIAGSAIPADAYTYLNYVRARARSVPAALPDIAQANLRTASVVPPLVNGKSIMPGGGSGDINYFRIAVLNERKWELCGEGDRIHDLIRMGVWYDVVTDLNTSENATGAVFGNNYQRKAQKFHCYRPIPQRERDLAPDILLQNAGY